MQRLASLRLASNFSGKALYDSTHISHPFTSFPSTRFFSRPWRSQAGSLSPKSLNLFSNPALAKAFSSHSTKMLLKSVAIRRFLDFRVAFQGLQRNFRPGSNFPSTLHEREVWLRNLSPDNLVLGLIIANTAVFILWRVANSSFMMNNFTISVENLKSLRLHTLITSAFSHFDTGHIMHNMIGLYFFGSHLGQVFGSEFLLKMYLAGGIVGSVFYVAHSLFLASSETGTMWKDPLRTPGLGASGAVNAIILLDIFLHPRSTLLLNFFIPVPAVLLGIYLVGKDFMGMIEGDAPGSAHLGGAAVAAVTWFRLRRGRF